MQKTSSPLILGSASRWRQQILKEAGYSFTVMHADIDEKKIRHDNPQQLVLEIANAKAKALLPKIKEPSILITVDQVVVCHDQIFEKPTSEEEVRYFCDCYSKYPAQTVTGVVVINTENGKKTQGIDIAKVYFNPIPNEEIDRIIARGEIFFCAGGFQIETESGEINPYIKKVEGSIDSVKGLPLELLRRLINLVVTRN